MKTLAEMRARLGEIAAKLAEYEALESYDQATVDAVNALNEEFQNLKVQIETKEKIEEVKAAATTSTRKSGPTELPRVEVSASRKEKLGGFQSSGEFLMAVKRAASGEVDSRLKIQGTAYEKNGEDGGFLVPEEISNEIQKKMGGDESLMARTTQRLVSGSTLQLPTDETQPWNGGVQAYWTAEGSPITSSKSKFGLASWRLHKLAALVPATDELLEDAVALESHIKASAPAAIMHKLNSAIISGDGVGKPLGILNSGFKVSVAKESGQAADTVVAKNVAKMYSRMIPGSRANAVWYINAAVEEQLRIMKDDLGNFIYIAPGSQLNQTPYGTLLGRPVLPMLGSMPALGDQGDIVFADLSYYYTILKSAGIKQAMSTHLLFDRDETAFKFTFRVDGSCPFKSPVTTEYGNYQVSGIVLLDERT
jgi:HK97 family phage major capsid protein